MACRMVAGGHELNPACSTAERRKSDGQPDLSDARHLGRLNRTEDVRGRYTRRRLDISYENEWYIKEHLPASVRCLAPRALTATRHRRHPALCGALPFCVARSSELGRMAQGGGHSLDPATAAAFPRRGALRLPLLPARRIGGLLRPKVPRKRMPHYLYLCASADGGTDGDVRSLLAKACRAGLVRHSLPGGSGRRRLGLVAMTVLMEKMGRAAMHDLQLYFKRAKACEIAFGDATWHRERVARLMTV